MVVSALLALGLTWPKWWHEDGGRLDVRVSSLPGWRSGDITLHGPSGLTRRVTRSLVFAHLQPGNYTIRTEPVRGSRQDLYPSARRQSVTVREGQTATIAVEYANVIPHSTKVLDARRLGVVGGTRGSDLTFEPGAASAASLHAGDVIVAGSGPATPYGLMRKVTAVHHGPDGRIRVSTRRATLHEAVPQGRINVRQRALLSPRDVRVGGSAVGEPALYRPMSGSAAEYQAAGAADPSGDADTFETGGDGTFSIAHTVREHTFTKEPYGPAKPVHGVGKKECSWGTTSPLLAQTMFKAEKPKIDFGAVWNLTQLNSVRWSMTTLESAGLRAATEFVEGKCEWKWTYPEPAEPVGEVVVEVGPVPLTFVVTASMVGVFGVGGKVSFDVAQKAQFTAGLQYAAGRATGIHSFQNSFSLAKPPSAEVEASLKGGVRYSLLLEGMVGPYLDITPGVKLVEKEEFGKNGAAQAELRAGLYTAAGLDLKNLGFDGRAVEIGDLWHKDKALATFPWRGTADGKAPDGREAACPASSTVAAAVADLDVPGDSQGRRVTGEKCWRDWAVADWVPNAFVSRVSTIIFKRNGARLTPAMSMLAPTGPGGDATSAGRCTRVKALHVPSGLLDYVCPSPTGASARAPFNPASVQFFDEIAGLQPILPSSELKRVKGPLRAVQVCGCQGDGSVQEVLLFYGNRYVGMVPDSAGERSIADQDGSTVTSRVHLAKPDDANCCPSGKTVTYRHVWRNNELEWTSAVK
ncbi:LppP/LprE family lipoprotein [Streptomyces sp. NBC_01601]|uniref:LppP/LprE family lipoprotein n=1 Tax=Streptomyces sp. NBC_01601 TaxID=2975892 RepID=UPI002E295A31|nr:LppP/LprE family lipoprotein [Streptomyces sp. NBC_01601]